MHPQPRPERFIPPAAQHVPVNAVRSVETRLSTTITEMDQLRHMIDMGIYDGTLPSWDFLLQRYNQLLGQIKGLTEQIGRTAPTPSAPGVPGEKPAPVPALASYLYHPLRPQVNDQVAEAQLENVLSTIPLAPVPQEPADADADGAEGAGREKTLTLEEFQGMDAPTLESHLARLRTRAQRESTRAVGLVREVARRAEEYDWALRIEDDEKDEDEDDDLFGDDEDVDMKPKVEVKPNPREGWGVGDYLAFLDSGRVKEAPGV